MEQDLFTYIVYTIFPVYIMLLLVIDNNIDRNMLTQKPIYNKVIILLIVSYVLFVGLRFEVGRDFPLYSRWYNEILNRGDLYKNEEFATNSDVGFITLIKLLTFFNAEAYWLFILIAFLQLIFLLKATESIKFLRPYIFFFYFALLVFFVSMNAMRQTIVFFILCYSIVVFNDRRFLGLGALLLFGLSLHKTLAIPLILMPFIHYKWYGGRIIQFIILVVSTLVLQKYVDLLLEMASPVINLLGYSYYVENLSYMYEITNETTRGDGTSSVLFFGIDAFIILFYNKLIEAFPSKFFKQVYGFFFVGLVLSRVFAENFILERIAEYFIFFRIFVLSYLAFYVYKIDRSKLSSLYSYVFSFILLGLVAFYYKAIYNNAADIAPFKFIFNG